MTARLCLGAGLVIGASAQDWKEVYDPLRVRTLHLQVDPTDWNRVVNDVPVEGQTESQERADAWFNEEGEAPILVEIRRKGATDPTLTHNGLTKCSLKIDINALVPGQSWNDLRKLSLEIGGASGPFAEGFGWQVHRLAADAGYYNYDAANAAWVKVYLNGDYLGMYTSTEQRDEQFLRNRDLYSDSNTWLYKVDGGYSLEAGLPDSPTYQFLDFAPFQSSKGGGPGGAAPDFETELPRWIDMKSMLTVGACNAYLENGDGLFKTWKNSFCADFQSPNERLRMYFPWDLDSGLKQGNTNIYGNFFANEIITHPWFKRVYEHIFRELLDGPLSVASQHALLDQLEAAVGPDLAADPFFSGGGNFASVRNWVVTRHANVLGQLTLPYVVRPAFNHPGGEVVSGVEVTMSAPAGTIYYTTDGSDPRLPGGAVSPSAVAYSAPLVVDRDMRVVARTLHGGNWSGLPSEVSFQLANYATSVVISEIMYHPNDINPGDTVGADQYEFIELHNTGAEDVDLTGYSFDGITYTFPGGSVIAAGARLVLVRDAAMFGARYPGVVPDGVYLGGLSNGGETIRLRNGGGTTVISVQYNDDPPWVLSPDGMGYSLVNRNPSGDPDDAANWSASAQPGGSPGAADPLPPYPTTIVFNEVLANTSAPYEDAVELVNSGGAAHDIGGWFLSDDARDINGALSPALLKKYRIPNSTVIGAGGFRAFYQNQFDYMNTLVPFGLSSHGERVYLSSADAAGNLTGHIIAMDFPATDPNVAYGRVPSSVGVQTSRLQQPTFGVNAPASASAFRGGHGAANSAPLVGPMVISEIMYNPPASGSEFVELHNVSGSTVNISGWDIDGISAFAFPSGTQVPAGGFVVVVDAGTTTAEAFRAANSVPAGVPVFATPFDLGNGGEALWLEKPNPVPLEADILVERVRYNDKAPWPTEADGAGPSLERLPPDRFGMEPLHWKTTTYLGTPGRLGIAQSGLAIGSQSYWDYRATASTPATDWMAPGYNDSGWQTTQAVAGYGEAFIAGVVPYGPDPSNRYITTYFRKPFSVTDDPANIASLELSLLYDDACVVYLNGTEVLRRGLPGGGVLHGTLASADIEAVAYETVDLGAFIPLLVQGANVIAVEVHQSGPASSDLVWDAELTFSLVVDPNDVDGDGLPALWEADNGFSDVDPNDAGQDTDRDGQSNRDEYLAGTNPNDPMSFFRIGSIAPSPGGWSLNWQSVPGRRYSVRYSSDLETWFNFGPAGEFTAAGNTLEFTDPSGAPPSARFYRVVVEP